MGRSTRPKEVEVAGPAIRDQEAQIAEARDFIDAQVAAKRQKRKGRRLILKSPGHGR